MNFKFYKGAQGFESRLDKYYWKKQLNVKLYIIDLA